MNEPFKCPDCGVWWRGETHKCYEERPKPRLGWISCPICGKNVTKYDWHTCSNIASTHNKSNWKRKPHGKTTEDNGKS